MERCWPVLDARLRSLDSQHEHAEDRYAKLTDGGVGAEVSTASV